MSFTRTIGRKFVSSGSSIILRRTGVLTLLLRPLPSVFAALEWSDSNLPGRRIRGVVYDRILGPPEHFEYQGSTTPD
jgi:hypothetical protein